MFNDLNNAVTTVDENQMTMDVLELSHTQERIQSLKNDLTERMEKASNDRVEWNKLQQVLLETEKSVAMCDKAMDPYNDRETSPRLQELEEHQRAVEEMLPRTETLVCDAVRRLGIILPRLKEDGERATAIRCRVREIETRFRDLVRAAREARIRLDARAVDQSQLRQGLENLQFWLDETTAELLTDFNPYDLKAIEEAIKVATTKNAQIAEKKSALVALELVKERLIVQSFVDPDSKHEARRSVSEVAKRIADIRSDLVDRLQLLSHQKRECESFWRLVDDVAHRGRDLHRRTTAITEAVIFTPSPDHVMACRSDAAVLKNDISLIKERVQRANAEHEKLAGKNEKKIVTVITSCNAAIAAASQLPEPIIPSAEKSLVESSHSLSTVVETKHTDVQTRASTTDIIDDEGELTEEETLEPQYRGRLESASDSVKEDEKSDL
ncbi:hypothetical protein DICVIV_02715 [Dictyocaulus viviparus]|uniref:Spectrin repeat-containing domain protein n=1 Tax=Dictyocaulus viviparus TaxID=29172 RepID=A0A0D8Y568_DICVI|nr:hypothetical protein DICVIV_02715 [Dictyocaulus viviparus]